MMKTAIFMSLIVLSYACGKNDDKKSDLTVPELLQGAWSNGCEGDPETLRSSKSILNITSQSMAKTQTFYTDVACSQASFAVISSEVINANSVPAASPPNAFQIDLTLNKLTVVPLSTESAALFNQEALYGFTDWILNSDKDVTGKDTEGQADATTVAGTKTFDIYKIDVKLSFGDEETGDGTSSEKRPTAVKPGAYSKL